MTRATMLHETLAELRRDVDTRPVRQRSALTSKEDAERIQPNYTTVLSVVVPTFNERDNVPELIRRLEAHLDGVAWEVVFVDDDSTDGTVDVLRAEARTDPRVRFLHRIGRRGLSSAVVEGVLSTNSPYIAVIDCDLQHDETKLRTMLDTLCQEDCDAVVASRYIAEGGVGEWKKARRTASQLATRLAHLVLPVGVSDPMSGFFMLTREAFDRSVRGLSGQGFKILLDILFSARPALKVVEVPYVFRERFAGESKLDTAALWDYLVLLLDKTVGRFVPVRFVMFLIVGGSGVLVHFATLAGLNQGLDYDFVTGQSVATVAAMTFNFYANNWLTYRDKRLKGFWALLGGLVSFYAVCAVGAVANVGIAAVLFDNNYSWWIAGIAGILIGAVWNFAASSVFTWRK